ncbi:peptidoglycan-binding protein [Alicyclobacillus dauci]|uniref:Peptidoglycan-binding protein n=1 Tax=Alicyclobacillus dauci TaxID=1475485 RepID=A0ABY6Z3K2_9BACL|nr:peptidoglycan-binding protein [Alicyclobacillus dauci]WAH36560.1 peptidoglycan-binding protein [Alicyclobacillus dauci]
MKKVVMVAAMSLAATGFCGTLVGPVTVDAATYPMRVTHVELNGKQLSSPDSFTYQNTTYMPLYYVQQLLKSLHLDNTWQGSQWNITAKFWQKPAQVLNSKTGTMSILVNNEPIAIHVNKIVTKDPASHQNTTYVPIWFIQQALKAVELQSTWNGTTWNAESNYTDYTKTGAYLAGFYGLADAKAALAQYPGGEVQDGSGKVVYTEASFTNVDLRYPAPANVNAKSLDSYLQSHNSILAGLGQVFIDAQATYGVDANYLVSHALEETGSNGNVSDIALQKNNLYGYGAFDVNAGTSAGTFPSEAYAIRFQAWEVRNNYLNPGASHYTSPTLAGMANNYASDPDWANKVNDLMDQLAIDMNDTVASYQQYTANNQPSTPANASTEPVYRMNGATGVVQADQNYGSTVPVYATPADGQNHLFARSLQMGTQGSDVETLQQALNQQGGTNLTVDGKFGAATQQALENFQTAHGLAATGVCDFSLWNTILQLSAPAATITAGQQVNIDEIAQGMAGGTVTAWYHVPNVGWIDANDVQFSNVYRVTVPNPNAAADVNVPVTDATGKTIATLHAGDYVVSTSPQASAIAVQFVNQDTGVAVSGTISSSTASLTKITS